VLRRPELGFSVLTSSTIFFFIREDLLGGKVGSRWAILGHCGFWAAGFTPPDLLLDEYVRPRFSNSVVRLGLS
jgi:hypothetical protein